MTDEEFLEAFESQSLPPGSLSHQGHVRLTWILLRSSSLLEAIRRLTCGFRAFAVSQGKPEVYHETMTWTFILLIHDRMQRQSDSGSWESFRAENRDLFRGRDLMKEYFREETLNSEMARETFLLPDCWQSGDEKIQS